MRRFGFYTDPYKQWLTIEKLAKIFIKQIQSRNKIDLTDKKSWFRGAYSTFQRPLSHIRAALDSAEKQDLQNVSSSWAAELKSALKKIPDDWMDAALNKIGE